MSCFTIGELKKFIEKHNLSDDAKIYYQRIEDFYFVGEEGRSPWDTLDIAGERYHMTLKHIEKARSGEWEDKEQYPGLTQDMIDSVKNITQEQLDKLKEQYVAVFTSIYYKEHPDKLFMSAHY
jgi:hypothetical protein